MLTSYARAALILSSFVLAACADRPQPPSDAELAAADAAKCQSYGLQPSTPAFEQCLGKLADQRNQAETSDRVALSGRLRGQSPNQKAW